MPKLRPGLRENITKLYLSGLSGDKVAKKLKCALSYVYIVLKSEEIPRRVGRYKIHKNKKEQQLRFHYGLDLNDYNRMFEEQRGRCAVCGIHQSKLKRALDIEHNHINGRIRGLACPKCNRGLGMFSVDEKGTELLENAINYLRGQK